VLYVELTTQPIPSSAKVFFSVVGAGFLGFGIAFIFRAREISAMARKRMALPRSDVKPGSPSSVNVRAFGVIFTAIGATVISLSVYSLPT
jgi:hypothetical protein